MELKNLKSAWQKYSSTDANRHQLGEDAIIVMLKKRTKSLIDKIDHNIRIGFGVMLLLTLFFVVDDLVLTPFLTKEKGVNIPTWIYITDAINTLFILCTFAYFSLRYYSLKKSYSQSNNLRDVLEGIIRILYSYRRLFYLALAILLLAFSVSFITGMFSGFEIAARKQGGEFQDLSNSQVSTAINTGIIAVLAFTASLFFIFRWGFRKLYGNYIQKLEDTLHELDEME